ncbi:UNKNOWN [Stylonychia lemnae]|uniref:Uncharacterized protein n=1 Tax=Stylonychia lemnae TaxID=5949 RepID=A0A078A1D5_STYLE|nr:UNKNOWN [Stylonychia lemnae]|eukprot:CDW75905.1 UNKNOWN [Stylonychia lemnae]
MNTTKVAQKNHIKLAQNYSRNGSQVRGPRSGSAANSGQSTPCNSNVILNQAHLSASGGSGSSQLYPMARNGSAQIFNFQYGQGKRDSINSNGSNGQRLNSLCNQEANNTKALSHKLLERMNILQSHLDVIGQNTAIHEPQFRQFYSKFEEQTVNMFSQGQNNEEQNSNQNGNYPIKKHKETLVGLKKEDYDKLMRDYNELKQCLCSSKSTLDKQVNDLTSMANDVEQHVVYQQEQQGILIKDLELRLKGHFIQQTQQLDKLIDSDYQELMSQYIEIMEDQIDQEYQENEQQISLIEQCINQIEEENDQRLQQIENILNDLDDLQLQQQSQNDPLKEQLQNWMSSQICQFQQNFDRELQGYYQKKVIMLNEEHQIIQEQLRSDIKQAEHKLTIRQSDTHSIQINQQQELSSRSSSVQTRLRNASQQKENQQDNQQNRQSYNSATRERIAAGSNALLDNSSRQVKSAQLTVEYKEIDGKQEKIMREQISGSIARTL